MNKKKIVGILGLAAVMVIGGTLAYFNQTTTIDNPFDTGKYDSVLVEDFNPSDGDNWEPGAEVNKDIEVKNTGDYDLIVRVKLDETWTNKSNSSWTKTNNGTDAVTIEQESATDGQIANDKSVVEKTFANSDNWVLHTDGYYYYKSNLKKSSTTGKFLDSVKLRDDADMGAYEVKNYYTKAATKPAETEIGTDAESQWVSYTGVVPNGALHTMSKTVLKDNAYGYGNADYVLTITAQTVQATDSALATFGLGTTQPTGCKWNLTQSK